MTQKPAIFLRPGEGEQHHLAPGVAGPPKHYHERMCDSFCVLNVNSPGGWDEVLRAIVNHAQRSGPVGSEAVGEMSAQRDMIVVE